MSDEVVRELSATDVIPLDAGVALRVESGAVLVFVVPRSPGGPGRRIPCTRHCPASTVTGADDPGRGSGGGRSARHSDLAAPGPIPKPHTRRWAGRVGRRWPGRTTPTLDNADQQWVQLHHDERVVDDALLELAATVPGERRPLSETTPSRSTAAVIDFLARQVGLHPDPLRLRRAVTDADVSGRDRVTALAAAAGAAVRPWSCRRTGGSARDRP